MIATLKSLKFVPVNAIDWIWWARIAFQRTYLALKTKFHRNVYNFNRQKKTPKQNTKSQSWNRHDETLSKCVRESDEWPWSLQMCHCLIESVKLQVLSIIDSKIYWIRRVDHRIASMTEQGFISVWTMFSMELFERNFFSVLFVHFVRVLQYFIKMTVASLTLMIHQMIHNPKEMLHISFSY